MMMETDRQWAYVETIHGRYPGMDIRSARQLAHDGEFNDILIINDDLVFRFPRFPENIPGFLQELQLLAKLQVHLPLPIPNPIYASATTNEPGKVFMGYQLIPGQPLHTDVMNKIANEAILQGLARQLADFLSALHHQTPASLGLDLPLQDMPDWVHTFYNEVREHLFSPMRREVRQSMTEHFGNYFNTPALQRYLPVIIHGDFGGSNILINDNQISGILDFSAAGYGDPALDIAAVSTYGEPFFSCFCQYYTPGEAMLDRAKFYRGIFALEEAWYGWKNNNKEAFKRGMEQYV
jgi:aminoglycoside 2''-phosphotransferase